MTDILHYVLPGRKCEYEWNETAIQNIKDLRRDFVHYQEACRSEMKQLKQSNIELSRWLKEQIKEYVQWEKSATIFLKWMEPEIGSHEIKDWPVDYSEKLNYISGRYYLLDHDLTFG